MRAVGRVSYSWYLWHWPVLVLAPLLLGHPLGLAGRLVVVLVSGGLAVLTLRLIENPLRYAAPLRRSPARSLAVGGVATAVAVSVCVALPMSMPIPVGRGAPAAPLTVTAALLPSDATLTLTTRRCSTCFAQVQAAVAASADLKTVPSNLNPPLADAAGELRAMLRQRLPAHILRSRTARVRDGRYRLRDDGGPGRRLACRDVASGVPVGRRRSGAGGWRHWPRRPVR